MSGKRFNFTQNDIDYIKGNYNDLSYEAIAEKIGCHKDQVRYQVRQLNLKKHGGSQPWTKTEEDFLRLHYIDKTDGWIGDQLKRTDVSILKKRVKLGLKRSQFPRIIYRQSEDVWTEEELSFLIENYADLDMEELSAKLKRSRKAIEVKATRLNLIRRGVKWNDKEDDFLKKNYKSRPVSYLSHYLHRTPKAISHRKYELGLNRDYFLSEPERTVGALLLDANKICVPQYKVGPYAFDYYVGLNRVIEVQGDYWHCNPSLYVDGIISDVQIVHMAHDKKKKALAEELGYEVIYIWELDINENLSKVKELVSRL